MARVADVSLGTVRMILLVGGNRWVAATLGFIEVAIWALALGGMVAYLDRPLAVIGYAGGFAAGTLVGLTIEDKLALGFRAVRVVSRSHDVDLAHAMREQGFRVTRLDGRGRDGPVEVLLIVMRRRRLREAMNHIALVAPNAFVTIERAERPAGGDLGRHPSATRRVFPGLLRK